MAQLYLYLCQLAGPARFKPQIIRTQLEKEYPGVDLSVIDMSYLQFSEEEYARLEASLPEKVFHPHQERHSPDDPPTACGCSCNGHEH